MMNYKNILVQIDGAKATITLNRPEVLNALNWDLLSEMEASLRSLEENNQIRVIIITGAGRAFSAGADLSHVKNILDQPLALVDFLHLAHRVHNFIEKMSKPVIAAINGLALAGGLELAISCDVIIASETARIGDQHANFGLIPGGGGTQRLPRLIGIRRAKELMFTGKWLTPAEAERIGLINQVVPADSPADEIRADIAHLGNEYQKPYERRAAGHELYLYEER